MHEDYKYTSFGNADTMSSPSSSATGGASDKLKLPWDGWDKESV